MSIITWLADKLGTTKAIPLTGLDDLYEEYETLIADVHIRELAFGSSVNMIANAVSKCEFKTFQNHKEIKQREYYLWNIEPNKNQNSSAFIHKWLYKLYRNKECVIIEHNGQLLVADSFNRKKYALYDDIFTDVTVGDFTFNRSFRQSEVLYYELSECDMRRVINGVYESYAKLIVYTMKAYQKSRGTKGTFEYGALPVKGTPEEKAFNELINNKFKAWLEADNGALPLGKGQTFKELTQRTYASETTRDIRAMIDDISDFTAKAFGIPPALLRGDVQGTKDALESFLTFCIDPLVDMLAEEINRKRNGYEGFSKGNYLKIDTTTIKHVDILSVATAIDKLISSGAFSVNDIRERCGKQRIDEEWADRHFMTKNYATVEDLLKALGLEGGEGNDSS